MQHNGLTFYTGYFFCVKDCILNFSPSSFDQLYFIEFTKILGGSGGGGGGVVRRVEIKVFGELVLNCVVTYSYLPVTLFFLFI